MCLLDDLNKTPSLGLGKRSCFHNGDLISDVALILGIMSIAILLVVTLGVLLSFVGVAYGAINLLTGEGFDVVIGQYELGLGTAIAGITIIVSALLYSGVTDLVPFIFKKMGQFFKFLVKKVKKLIVWLYRYSTQL